jgi:hypothetical protein
MSYLSEARRRCSPQQNRNIKTKINTMKLITKSLLATVLSAGTLVLVADDTTQPQPPAGEHRRPVSPVIAALDVNGDGVIDATEIANAANALLTLDKNGDGQLTPDELRPAHPEGGPGGKHGQRPPPPATKQ